jgi:hypothetical protein
LHCFSQMSFNGARNELAFFGYGFYILSLLPHL